MLFKEFKKKEKKKTTTSDTYLVNLVPVEVRFSLDLSSASFFGPSFLNGSFLAFKTLQMCVKYAQNFY